MSKKPEENLTKQNRMLVAISDELILRIDEYRRAVHGAIEPFTARYRLKPKLSGSC
jgi:hypothetical protein